jgi:hypothetical protein
MPPQLVEKYQHFTEAKMATLTAAGYHKEFTPMEAGVGDYVQAFLGAPSSYR